MTWIQLTPVWAATSKVDLWRATVKTGSGWNCWIDTREAPPVPVCLIIYWTSSEKGGCALTKGHKCLFIFHYFIFEDFKSTFTFSQLTAYWNAVYHPTQPCKDPTILRLGLYTVHIYPYKSPFKTFSLQVVSYTLFFFLKISHFILYVKQLFWKVPYK